MNQFGAVPEEKYTIQVDKRSFKLWRRLLSITEPCELHLTFDEKGRIKSVKKFQVKEELLED